MRQCQCGCVKGLDNRSASRASHRDITVWMGLERGVQSGRAQRRIIIRLRYLNTIRLDSGKH
jgi:hypothetical protein